MYKNIKLQDVQIIKMNQMKLWSSPNNFGKVIFVILWMDFWLKLSIL